MEALTPHHFLLERPSIAIPFLPDAQKYLYHRKMFRVAQAHMDLTMAKRVSSSAQYSPEMVQRTPPLNENDLVWIIGHRGKRGFYRLGRVIKSHFGNDDNIRSYDVLTQSGLIAGSTIKLSRVIDDIGCVSPQDKHRAGDEKA